jgi:hypothetical protein
MYSSNHTNWYKESQRIYNYAQKQQKNVQQQASSSYNESNNDTMTNAQRRRKLDDVSSSSNIGDQMMYIVNTDGYVVQEATTDYTSIAYPTFHISPPPSIKTATAVQNIDLSSIDTYRTLSYASIALKGKYI